MTRRISAVKARQELGALLERVRAKGEHIIVRQAGRPMAVIVPVEFYESWERRRAELFAMVDGVRSHNRRVSGARAAAEVAEAQRAVRRPAR